MLWLTHFRTSHDEFPTLWSRPGKLNSTGIRDWSKTHFTLWSKPGKLNSIGISDWTKTHIMIKTRFRASQDVYLTLWSRPGKLNSIGICDFKKWWKMSLIKKWVRTRFQHRRAHQHWYLDLGEFWAHQSAWPHAISVKHENCRLTNQHVTARLGATAKGQLACVRVIF